MKLLHLLSALAIAFCGLTPGTGHAEPTPLPSYPEPPAALWQRSWPTFSRIEGAATLAAGVGTGVLFVFKPPEDPRW